MLKSTPGKIGGGGSLEGGLRGPQGGMGGFSPLMGAPKTVATPTACAATSISFCLNLFCHNPNFLVFEGVNKIALNLGGKGNALS